MNGYWINDYHVATDAEGYLCCLADWSPAVADVIAANEGIELTAAHWEVIKLLQQFYEQFEISPAMRPLTKYVGDHLGKEKGGSIYLLRLFPGSPAKVASKIAGLPRPVNCL